MSRRGGSGQGAAARAGAQEGARPLRVGLYGGFGTGNTGNDATAAVTVEHLRRTLPDLDLRLITYGPQTEAIARRLGVATVSTQSTARSRPPLGALGPIGPSLARATRLARELASTWSALRSVDAVVVLGCGIFEAESTVGGRGWRAMADLYLVSLASSLGAHRLAFVGVGGTVLRTRAERVLVVAAMRRAAHRTFRDEASKAALLQMGGGGPRDLVVADLVFAADLGEVGGGDAEPGPSRPQIALGVMSFDWLRREDGVLSPQDPYLRSLAETAAVLVREGSDVVVFAGDVADRAAVDLVAAEARGRLGGGHGEGRIVTLHATTLADQVPVLAAADTVVGSRFHNAVTALMLGKEPIVVADRTKIRTLMTTTGLGDRVLEARTLTAADLVRLVARARAERPATEARTASAVEGARERAARGLHDLDRLVRRWENEGTKRGRRTGNRRRAARTDTDPGAAADIAAAAPAADTGGRPGARGDGPADEPASSGASVA